MVDACGEMLERCEDRQTARRSGANRVVSGVSDQRDNAKSGCGDPKNKRFHGTPR